ncbi:MAG: methyltransferase [Clostridia bacterium]|nr:methyltransferase [Clostridia bacterium]
MYEVQISGIILRLETAPDLFSPAHADKGTLAMLSLTSFDASDRVLDLGCGVGIVGIYAARCGASVMMTDFDAHAVCIARENCASNGVSCEVLQSDGFSAIEPGRLFTQILSNPPYHTDFSVAKRFIEGAFRHLEIGGRLFMVTKRLDWYKNKLISVFGGVRVHELDGYYVFIAEKRSARPPVKNKSAPTLSKKLARKVSGK